MRYYLKERKLIENNMSDSFLDHLEWRFATKKFDASKPLEQEKLDKILESIRMTPTSYGLQTMHVHVVTDQEIKKKMKAMSYMQSQVVDAPVVLVFSARTDVKNRIKQYIDVASDGKTAVKLKMKPYELMMNQSVGKLSEDAVKEWSARQAYIALGFAMAACAELEVDSCPMEGFSPEKLDKLLGLPEHMKSVVLLPIGYREKDPERKKVRFSSEDMFTNVS